MLSRIWYYAPPGLAVILDVDPVIEISVLLHPVSVQLLQPTPPRPGQNMCPRGRLLQVRGYALNASERRARGKSRKYQSRRVNRQPPGGQGSADPVRTRGDLAQRKSGAMSWAMASRPWRGRQSPRRGRSPSATVQARAVEPFGRDPPAPDDHRLDVVDCSRRRTGTPTRRSEAAREVSAVPPHVGNLNAAAELRAVRPLPGSVARGWAGLCTIAASRSSRR